MNTNRLEKQLESWIPRRPSARLKERIFAADGKNPETALKPDLLGFIKAHLLGTGPTWVKFAPACCILLLIMLFGMGRQERTAYFAVATGSNAVAGLSSNLLALCANDSHHHRENVWTAVTFDWTKDGHCLSTIGSSPVGKTNGEKL